MLSTAALDWWRVQAGAWIRALCFCIRIQSQWWSLGGPWDLGITSYIQICIMFFFKLAHFKIKLTQKENFISLLSIEYKYSLAKGKVVCIFCISPILSHTLEIRRYLAVSGILKLLLLQCYNQIYYWTTFPCYYDWQINNRNMSQCWGLNPSKA